MCAIPSEPSKGEHLAAYLLEPSLGTLTSGDRSINIRMYRATIRLLNIVFCILGCVTTAITMKDQPSKEFRTITLPLWPAQRIVLDQSEDPLAYYVDHRLGRVHLERQQRLPISRTETFQVD